jgi:hypothetical protein
MVAVNCRVDAVAGSFSCGEQAGGSTGAAGCGDRWAGRVCTCGMMSGAVTVTEGVLSAPVRVQNLTSQAMATIDGDTPSPDGIRIFFHTGPTNGVTVG